MTDFIANFFELWGLAYFGSFSQCMYKADLYLAPFWWLILLPAAVLLVYYKLWDNIRLAKTWIWAVIVLATSLLVAAIAFNIADEGLYDYLNAHHITNSKIEDADYFYFALVAFGWTAVWSLILSLIFKSISVKGRYIPF